MVGHVGVEVAAPRLDNHFAQQAGCRELMQCVVDGRQRNRNVAGLRLAMQLLGRDMAVAAIEQQPAQRQALSSRPQASGL